MIDRGYITRYTIKLILKGHDYSNMIIEGINIIIDKIYCTCSS